MDNETTAPVIPLSPEDVRIGQLKYLEVQRLHDLYHAAQADFGRWANAMAGLYGVPAQGYIIGDPACGFVPSSQAGEAEHHHG